MVTPEYAKQMNADYYAKDAHQSVEIARKVMGCMDIRTYLSQGKPLLFDGAMGTYFAAHPGRAEERCERANLTRPEEILHTTALICRPAAGPSRPIPLPSVEISPMGTMKPPADIVNAACHLARQAAQPYGAYVFADLGPRPRDHSRAPADLYQTQAQWFLEQGVTHFWWKRCPMTRASRSWPVG